MPFISNCAYYQCTPAQPEGVHTHKFHVHGSACLRVAALLPHATLGPPWGFCVPHRPGGPVYLTAQVSACSCSAQGGSIRVHQLAIC